MPPYFSLGYHHSRYSFQDEKDVLEVDKGFTDHKIPLDVLHLDIDHTEDKKYFTFDLKKYPNLKQMFEILDDNGKKSRKVVAIVDPHIKKDENYFVYSEAMHK